MKTKYTEIAAAMDRLCSGLIALKIFFAEYPDGNRGGISIRVFGGGKHQQRRKTRKVIPFQDILNLQVMKMMLVLVCCCIIVFTFSHTNANSGRTKQQFIDSTRVGTPDFKSVILPLLQKNCSPCHFPGGKMYAKMPFDKAETIVNHQVGALKGFNDINEKELLKQFIENEKLH